MRSVLALTLLAAAASSVSALAVPAQTDMEVMKRNIIQRYKNRKRNLLTMGADDVTILNFALTLEHLEATFYSEALSRFNASSFEAEGFGGLYPVLERVAQDEAAHVEFLTSALSAAGANPVEACQYSFPYTDVTSFLTLSQIIEGVGVSAYLGAAGDIANKEYLTAAASILTVEARHAAALQLINQYQPASQPFDTPLDAASVVTLVSPYFVSCPEGSAPAITGNPAVNASTIFPGFGGTLGITPVNASSVEGKKQVYCGYASGLQLEFTPWSNNSCAVPPQDSKLTNGQTYVVLTSEKTPTSVLAGPAIIVLGQAQNISFSVGSGSAGEAGSNSTAASGSDSAASGSASAATAPAASGAALAASAGSGNGAGSLKVGGAAGLLAAVIGGMAVLF
ncbi:hypothetical protein JCM11251_000088 [Rhodosporidiobolus azoricus]